MQISRINGPDPAAQEQIKSFISKLDSLMVELAENGKETTRSDFLTNEEHITPEIDEISEEASGIFIDSEGRTKNTLFLSIYSAGRYEIVRGEYGSFGWITGVIITPKGRIVYG